MCSVITFLNAKKVCPVDIYWQFVEVYRESVRNEGNVYKWCRLFDGESTHMLDKECSSRPTVITEIFVNKVMSMFTKIGVSLLIIIEAPFKFQDHNL